MPYTLEDIALTNGAFAALTVTLNAITEPGDESIFISPSWFFYEGMISNAGAKAVRVKMNPGTFAFGAQSNKSRT